MPKKIFLLGGIFSQIYFEITATNHPFFLKDILKSPLGVCPCLSSWFWGEFSLLFITLYSRLSIPGVSQNPPVFSTHLIIEELELQICTPPSLNLCDFWGSKRRASHLYSKCFTHWAKSLSSTHFFFFSLEFYHFFFRLCNFYIFCAYRFFLGNTQDERSSKLKWK